MTIGRGRLELISRNDINVSTSKTDPCNLRICCCVCVFNRRGHIIAVKSGRIQAFNRTTTY